ncbi:hypothetical protein G6F37_006943 [Rhizopus arrhizus]|nr:hypothetical protein G6F38_000481 [Rhizopus arrhizus]KAG1157176.1 hypothetical protein G6F37_006943 [Rhizopus arrhizus]
MLSEQKIIRLCNTCHLCHKQYANLYSLRRHYQSIHNVEFKNRKQVGRRTNTNKYIYVEDPSFPGASVHHACTGCSYHTRTLENLEKHILKEHEPYELKDQDEDDYNEDKKKESGRRKVRILSARHSRISAREESAEDLANEAMRIIIKKLDTCLVFDN